MSHEVETMAYAHETPWHGLGRQVDGSLSPEEMCTAAGLDWSVEKVPMFVEYGERYEVPGKRALVRSTDGKIFDVVGEGWRPVQNVDALRFFKSFVEAGEATMETAGSLRGGRLVWGLGRLNQDFKLPGGDEVRGYVLLASPHEAGKSTIGKVVGTRVVCANTMAMAFDEESKFEARFSHRFEFDPIAAREAMGLAREQFGEFERLARQLLRLRLSHDDVVRLLAPIYQPGEEVDDLVRNPEIRSKRVAKILECYETAPGAVPGTGWGALNGLTYWTDHVAGRESDERLTSSWVGTESKRKQRFLDDLLALAA